MRNIRGQRNFDVTLLETQTPSKIFYAYLTIYSKRKQREEASFTKSNNNNNNNKDAGTGGFGGSAEPQTFFEGGHCIPNLNMVNKLFSNLSYLFFAFSSISEIK